MISLKRSTNERVLARHHLKRLPAVLDPVHQAHNAAADDSDDDDPDSNGIGGIIGNLIPGDTTTTPAVRTTTVTPAKPTVTVLPPIGKTTSAALTTTSAVATPITSSTVSKVVTTPASTSAPVSTPGTSTPLTTPTSSPVQTDNRGVSSTSPVSESSPTTSASSGSSQGVSPGAIGATVAVLVLFALAFAAFFVRKRHQRRRAMKRNTWGAGLVPALENRRQSIPYGGQSQPDRPMSPYGSEHERLANVPAMSQTPVPQTFGVPPPLGTPSTVLTPVSNAYAALGPPGLARPGSSYNPALSPPPTSLFAPSVPAPSLRSVAPSMSSMGPISAAPAAEFAIVARTFIPSLPDELHISNGEQIRVISAYDDGWALCANVRGEQGVVPLECLERGGGASTEMQLQPQSEIGYEANRTSRRISSLAPNAGTY